MNLEEKLRLGKIQVKICDLGIARVFHPKIDHKKCRAVTNVGTLGY